MNFSEVIISPTYIKKDGLKATFIKVKNLINNQTLLMYDPEKGETVTPCMDVYKAKI